MIFCNLKFGGENFTKVADFRVNSAYLRLIRLMLVPYIY